MHTSLSALLNPRLLICILTVTAAVAMAGTPDAVPIEQARYNARLAAKAFNKIQSWLHEEALPRIDAETGLLRDMDDAWNYQDSAADCMPFVAWAAWFTDRAAFDGPVRRMLHAEQRLCSHHDGVIPVNFPLKTRQKFIEQPWPQVVFYNSEYLKDGLAAIVEAVGPGEFLDRMIAINGALWNRADIDSPHGKQVSSDIEVNGDQLQVLVRLFGWTGQRKWLDLARRIADYYISGSDPIPVKLDDHGCEIICGLGMLQGVLATVGPDLEREYRPKIRRMLDTILERGINSDGLMLFGLADTAASARDDQHITDNWGYNYVAMLCYDMATGEQRYQDAVRKPLRSLAKPMYHLHPWENAMLFGPADSVEGAIYLLSAMPVQEGINWVDRETQDSLIGKPGKDAHKYQCNVIRTVVLYALSRTQGVYVPQWRPDLQLGSVRNAERLYVYLTAEQPWEGRLFFDFPRHREWLHFDKDWPRINYLPEYYTIESDRNYYVRLTDVVTSNPAEGAGPIESVPGRQLREGFAVKIQAGQEFLIEVRPAP